MVSKITTKLILFLLLCTPAHAQVVDLEGDSLPVLNDQLRRIETMLTRKETTCEIITDVDGDNDLDGDDDVQSIYRPKGVDWIITSVFCETNKGTVNLDLQIDDGSVADVHGTDLACVSTDTVEVTSLNGDTELDSEEELDVAITSVANSPTKVTVCWTGIKRD